MECRHHPRCPGCPLLELPYDAQLRQKRDRLKGAFGRYPHLRLPLPEKVHPAQFTEGYRHRLKLPVKVTKDHVAIGLYDAQDRVLDTPDCPVLEPRLRAILAGVLVWMRGRNGIHSVDLRVSSATGEAQLVLACEGGDLYGGAKAVRQLMGDVPGLVSVAVSQADRERKRVLGGAPQIIAGADHIDERIGETRYHLHAGAFFQVDPRNATWIHDRVKAFVGDAKSVLDLYAGVGAYALMLAPGRERVVMVEEVTAAAKSAIAVAPDNVTVVRSRVEDARVHGPFDVAILNPARRGSDPRSLATIAKLAPRLVYVSCGPETLARDLDILAAHGMRVKDVDAVDLFPHTPEVETVVHLVRGPPLLSFNVQGGKARGPWLGKNGPAEWSGAEGRPQRVLALVLHDPGPNGNLPGARFRRIGLVATHALIRIDLEGPLVPALAALSKHGHAVVGRDPRTARFFQEKAGLVRPFVHVERTAKAQAPLHGDLVEALVQLGADATTLARAGVS